VRKRHILDATGRSLCYLEQTDPAQYAALCARHGITEVCKFCAERERREKEFEVARD
jgi:hypothetical protein